MAAQISEPIPAEYQTELAGHGQRCRPPPEKLRRQAACLLQLAKALGMPLLAGFTASIKRPEIALGIAVAKTLLARGLRVALVDVNKPKLEEVAASLGPDTAAFASVTCPKFRV